MIRNDDLLKIQKIAIFSLISLSVIATVSYFIFTKKVFLAITTGEFLAFITFIATLLFYYGISRRRSSSMLKYILPAFLIKIVFVGTIFYLIFRFNLVNLMVLGLAFIIFFTIFFNIEVILIYKKLLFKQ
jgi:hypothetical protein